MCFWMNWYGRVNVKIRRRKYGINIFLVSDDVLNIFFLSDDGINIFFLSDDGINIFF